MRSPAGVLNRIASLAKTRDFYINMLLDPTTRPDWVPSNRSIANMQIQINTLVWTLGNSTSELDDVNDPTMDRAADLILEHQNPGGHPSRYGVKIEDGRHPDCPACKREAFTQAAAYLTGSEVSA